MISGGLIIVIGAQNAFILRQGLQGEKVFYVCAVCFICDVILITLGILVMGSILENSPYFLNLLAIFGAMFLYWYGGHSFTRAYKGNSHLHIEQRKGKQPSLAKLMLTTLAITLLNPHVI